MNNLDILASKESDNQNCSGNCNIKKSRKFKTSKKEEKPFKKEGKKKTTHKKNQ